MEVYESHLGGIYLSDNILDFNDLYCDECGDCDWHLGHADIWEEVLELLADVGWYGSYSYLEDLKNEFEAKTKEK